MTVVGVGLDVVDVDAFSQQLGQPGTRFTILAFTAGERSDVGDADPRRLAARFAAKEAFLKAWSSSRFAQPATLTSWQLHDVEVVNDVEGRPALRLHGAVAAAVDQQMGPAWRAHVSLSHDGPVAAALVVLERPGPDGGTAALDAELLSAAWASNARASIGDPPTVQLAATTGNGAAT